MTEARALLARSLELDPGNEDAVRQFANTYAFERQLTTDDLRAIMQVYNPLPNGKGHVVDLIWLLSQRGQVHYARAMFDRLDPTDTLHIATAESALFEGEIRAARTAAREAHFDAADSLLDDVLATASQPGLQAHAVAVREEIATHRSGISAVSHYNDGVRAVRENRYTDARALFEQVRSSAADTALVRKSGQMIERLDDALRHGGRGTAR
jgi:hypothetical protein